MNIKDLNREQKIELKQMLLDSRIYEKENRGASYGELANADEFVSDEELLAEYNAVDFLNDDFLSSAGKLDIGA